MKTLKEISTVHFNETVLMISENTRLTNIAKCINDKNALLKLKLQLTNLKCELEYHRKNLI